jgi:ribosomal-protein-alanine N-acetyltransferase
MRSIELVPYAAEALLALTEQGAEAFEGILGHGAADGLRGFLVSDEVSPEWLRALRSARGTDPWRWGFAVLERESGLVVGNAGFRGEPDAEGVVEIAYGIVPSRERRGYATAAAAALVEFARRDPRVRHIRAHTLPEPNPSTRVLTKCGFSFRGAVIDPEDGRVWRWERDRDD